MIFLTLTGRQQKIKNVTRYLIDWDKSCRSKIQKRIKDLLYKHWVADIVFEELPVAGTRMTLDFYNASRKIAVEVDGNQHYKFNKFFHSNSRQKFLAQLQRDDKKENFCDINQIALARVLESDTLDEDLLRKLNII